VFLAVAPNGDLEPVDSALTTETPSRAGAGDLVGVLVEFSAGMEVSHDDSAAETLAFGGCRSGCREPSSRTVTDPSDEVTVDRCA